MLRLKPSELTLTPEDVDETLRRMARRQQSRPPAAPGQRHLRASTCSLAPRVKPGAQRSMRDAITDLGNIPILRPQPQQAIIAHVDDESEDSDETLAESAQRVESSPDPITMPTQPLQLASTSSAAAPPARHSTRLAFRLGHSHRPGTDQDPFSSPKEQSEDSEGTLVEPAGCPTETTNVAGPATPGCRTAAEDFTADSSPTRQSGPSTTPASLRGGASRPHRNRVQSVGQDALHAPSPLRQTQIPSPTHQPEGGRANSDKKHPMIYLQGYFEERKDSNVEVLNVEVLDVEDLDVESSDAEDKKDEYTYTFRQMVPRAPQTEPFRRTSQPRFHMRSHSSNDAPPSRLFTPTSKPQSTSAGEDIFWTAAAPATERPNDGRMSERLRQHSSEMSNTSLAFSYYELPENRQSSSEHSAQGSVSQSQWDGASASRQASRGTYRSVRLSEAQALGDSAQSPPTPNVSSFATPVPANPNQFGTSPLPAEPYARPPGGSMGARHQSTVRRRISQDSLDHRVHSNAIAAAMENRVSPLDALTAQYGRASQRLGDHQGHHQRHSQPGSGYSVYNNAGLGTNTYGLHQFAYAPPSGTFGTPQGAFDPPMAMADDPYTRGASAHTGQPHGSTARPVSTQPAPAANYAGPPYPRSAQGTRSSQRSSENAHGVSSVQGGRTGRTSQVQDQVSAFEQMHNAAQPRQTRQRLEIPQAPPAQRNNELPSSPMPAVPPRIPPRHGSRQHTALSPGLGNAGRRSVRMDPRLQNQENSGEAEMEMMRQDFESARMRYNEDQQGDVMDETPPRIGRVERHM
ncbi:hypothetical protein BU25DRAFT_420593 [Macroventuria anomochaeta]|uniref:Uncharacterized protein n=1 Tax=Macroventuria anomochaeta TaxID=301207 RepID=A0ACB6S3S2_9PLEO|nr:uncharacterized protein BU25DRAFT_420593 [Macroventuria anomochaeta]KAF2628622.1 hypothetical protein BU25DRAFT_420593 [Macroventuria anomochaeta]